MESLLMVGDGYGSSSSVFRIEAKGFREALKKLGLTWDNAYKNLKNDYERGFRNNGLWSWYRDIYHELPVISVGVGCSCAHDCCGCVCGLSYKFIRDVGGYVVIKNVSINV